MRKDFILSQTGITMLLAMLSFHCFGQSSNEVISLGLPYLRDKNICQDLFIKNDTIKITSITITCTDITKEHDSAQVYAITIPGSKSKKKGVYYTSLNLTPKNKNVSFHTLYKDILLKNHNLPAGNYHARLTLRLKDSSIISKTFLQQIDSQLSDNATARKELDNIYSPKGKTFLGMTAGRIKSPSGAKNVRATIKKSSGKINRTFSKKGYTVSNREMQSLTLADIYYQDRYVGYYQINMNEPIAENIEKRKAQLDINPTSGIDPKLEDNKTVFSQVRETQAERKKNEVIGNISLTGNTATGQEENSQAENNYYELAAQAEVPIMGIPVNLEAYYTSQDENRPVKSSYIRLHYDTEQSKAELLKLISAYNNKYDEASARGKGMENIYGTYLGSLQTQKTKLLSDITAETGIPDIGKFGADTAGLLKEMTAAYEKKITDSTQAKNKKEQVTQRCNKTMNKYRQVQALENKAQHYRTLLEQYRNNNYFDSVIAYGKLKDINKNTIEDKSYKQLSKTAGSILPEGAAKKLITGLNTLDAGIFNKRISTYTLNGQTIKGIDLSYDLGICETGITYGRVEYINRNGQLDKYNGYSVRTSFQPARKQKTTLVYYGYMPSKKMLNEPFFNKIDATMPTFKDPIHILSILHEGAITQHTNIEAEAATSFRTKEEFQRKDLRTTDKIAYNLTIEENIPQTTVDLKGGYEHIGKQFENNTLPLNLSGTDKYSAGAKARFFQNFLTLAVDYNHLIQYNLASQSAHTKWGFEIKTTSKRYPSASLSYKPFTTFRSVADTLHTPQRPILGEVWLGKLSYQLKKNGYILRLTAIYNKNTATADTIESGSNIAQLNTIYTKDKLNLMLNAGQTQMKTKQATPIHNKTKFLTIAAAYALTPQWTINAGQDIAMTKNQLSRYAINLGGGYRFQAIHMTLAAAIRYNTYKIPDGTPWKNIYTGMLDMTWYFRFKTKDKM